MGNFSNNAITDVGRMLLADVQAGAIFTPTRIVIGSGSLPGGATTQGMTDVIKPVKSLTINKKKRTPDGKCVFGGVYTNEEVTEAFYFRELALYAKAVYHNADGSVKSEGAETLYSYGNAGTTADYMPAYSTSTVVEKQMDLVTWVGNDAQVDLSIESGIYITHEGFDSHAARHAADGDDPITPASIGAAPSGYGLGGYPQREVSLSELDSVFDTGWYILSQYGTTLSGVGFNYANVLVHCTANRSCVQELRILGSNIVLRRYAHLDEWSEWEVENPPFDIDVEYRTPERRNNKAVYKKLGSDGVLKYRLEGNSEWLPYAAETGAAYAPAVITNHMSKAGWYKIGIADSAPYHGSCFTFHIRGMYYMSLPVAAVVDVVITYQQAEAKTRLRTGNIDTQITKIGLVDEGNGIYSVYVYYAIDYLNAMEIRVEDPQNNFTPINFEPADISESNMATVVYLKEYDHPPLEVGVVYRTSDRYKGAAVYKMVDAAGNILWRAEYENSWHLLSSASYVSPATIE